MPNCFIWMHVYIWHASIFMHASGLTAEYRGNCTVCILQGKTVAAIKRRFFCLFVFLMCVVQEFDFKNMYYLALV